MSQLVTQGYSVSAACQALNLARSRYYATCQARLQPESSVALAVSDGALLTRIRDLKTEHPFWGYRRIRAWLVHREGQVVNSKRVRRIMHQHGLMTASAACEKPLRPFRSKPRADRPRQYWGIDMTKFLIPSAGWVYLVVVLDWYTKKIVGWDLALRSRAAEWKRAMDQALNREFPNGVRGQGLKLVNDNGSQPTATSFMSDMAYLGIEQVFTSYDNPRGNADTERVMRTIKEEEVWLNEYRTLEEARERIGHWIEVDYNRRYVHSTLGYLSPEEFERAYWEEIRRKTA